jgi:hypothetical protein
MLLMTDEDFEKICYALERTHKGLLSICQEVGYNTESPFRNFMKGNDERELRYARAREKQIDYLEDLLREIVFDESRDSDVIDKVNIGSNAVARDRLKADTLKFILSKLRPSVYGTKVELTQKAEPRIFNV